MKSKRRAIPSKRRKPEAIFRKIHRKEITEKLKQSEYYPGIYTEKKQKVKQQTPKKKRPKIKKLFIKKRAKKRNKSNLNILKKKAKQNVFRFSNTKKFIKFNVSKQYIYRKKFKRRIKFIKLRSKFFKLKSHESERLKLKLMELKLTEQELKKIEIKAKRKEYKETKKKKLEEKKKKEPEPEEELPPGHYKVKLEQLHFKPQFSLYKKKVKYNTFKHIKRKKYSILKKSKEKSCRMFEKSSSTLANKDILKFSKIIVKKRKVKNKLQPLLFKALINFISIMKFSQLFRNLSINNVESIFMVFNHFPFFESFWLHVARYFLADVFLPRKHLSDLLTTVEYTFKLQYELKKKIFSYKENETIFITLLSLIQKSFLNYKTSKIEYYLAEILKLKKKQLSWLIFVMYKLSDLFLTFNQNEFNIYYVYFIMIVQFIKLREKALNKLDQTDKLLDFCCKYKTLYQKLIDIRIEHEKPASMKRSCLFKEVNFIEYLNFSLIYIYIFDFFNVLQKQANRLRGLVMFLLYVQVFLYCFDLSEINESINELSEFVLLDEIGRQLFKIKLGTVKKFKVDFKTIHKILELKKRLELQKVCKQKALERSRSLKLKKIFLKARVRVKKQKKKLQATRIFITMNEQLFRVIEKLLELKRKIELFRVIEKLLELKRKIENKEEIKPKKKGIKSRKKEEEIKSKKKKASKEQLIFNFFEEKIKVKSTKESKWKAHMKAEIEFSPLLFRNNVRKKKKIFFYKKSQFYIQKLRKRVNFLRKINRIRAYNLPTNRKKYYRRQKYQYIDENFISFYRQV